MRRYLFKVVVIMGLFLLSGCSIKNTKAESTEQPPIETPVAMQEKAPEGPEKEEQKKMKTEEVEKDKIESETGTLKATKSFYTTAMVNVRVKPDKEAEIYKKVPYGSEVEGDYFNEKWCQVVIDGKIFYMSRDYLREKIDRENGFVVVIDPGHQKRGNSEKEPVGPGAKETKAKVAGGTAGRITKIPEYEITLQIGLKLKHELENRGYVVVMTREENEVNLSNAERAAIANAAAADAFVRLHANGSENTSVHGVMTICQTRDNPYNAFAYEESRRLSEAVLDEAVEATGASKEYVWETDTMSGINWSVVPSTIIEMGYMTNEKEDRLLTTEDYQYKMADGIANGIDKFLMKEE